jgi:hypothetical protein
VDELWSLLEALDSAGGRHRSSGSRADIDHAHLNGRTTSTLFPGLTDILDRVEFSHSGCVHIVRDVIWRHLERFV